MIFTLGEFNFSVVTKSCFLLLSQRHEKNIRAPNERNGPWGWPVTSTFWPPQNHLTSATPLLIQRKSKLEFRASKTFIKWGNEELLRVLTQMEKTSFHSQLPLQALQHLEKKSGTWLSCISASPSFLSSIFFKDLFSKNTRNSINLFSASEIFSTGSL